MNFDPTDKIDRAKRNLRDALAQSLPYPTNIVEQIQNFIDAKIAEAIKHHERDELHG